MKITIIRIIFLVFWTAFLSGCQSRQAALTFKTYATNANEARLELNGNTWTVPYDSLQGAVFKLQDINPGYAHLRLGNFQKILYIEPGTDLIVTYQRPGKSRNQLRRERSRREYPPRHPHPIGQLTTRHDRGNGTKTSAGQCTNPTSPIGGIIPLSRFQSTRTGAAALPSDASSIQIPTLDHGRCSFHREANQGTTRTPTHRRI